MHEVSQETVYGPAEVERTEEKLEMGVLYAPGVPSPMEGAHYNEPIVVDGLVAKTGGDGLGCPVQYIKLSAWYAPLPPGKILRTRPLPCSSLSFGSCRDPTPVECKYSGLRFVSKKAINYA